MHPVQWLDEARTEAAEESRKLGLELWDEMERRLAFAQRFPHAATQIKQIRSHVVRRFLLDRFQFALVIAVRERDLVVVAFHDQRRRPGYWKPRLTKVRP